MTYNDFKKLCNDRRSVRYFDAKPVSREDILDLLELGRLAPSIHNLQPWRFHVVTSPDLRKKLMEASCYGNFIEGAGVFIIMTCDASVKAPAQDPVWNPYELDYSCMAAMTQIMLGATAKGLGSCWVSLHHGQPYDVLNLSRHEEVVGGLMIGHLKKGEEESSAEHERRPLKELVTFHD